MCAVFYVFLTKSDSQFVCRKSKSKHGHANGGAQKKETVSAKKVQYIWTHTHSVIMDMDVHIHDNVLYFRLLCASPSWTQWVNLTPACMTCTGCPAMPMVRETDRYNCSLWHTYTRLIYHTYIHALADARACKGWRLQRRVMVRCLLAHVPTDTDVWSARLRMTVVKLTHRTHTSQSLIYIGF